MIPKIKSELTKPFFACLLLASSTSLSLGAVSVQVTGTIGTDTTTWVFNGTMNFAAGGTLSSTGSDTTFNSWNGENALDGGLNYAAELSSAPDLNNGDYDGTYVSGSSIASVGSMGTVDFLGIELDWDFGTSDFAPAPDDFKLQHGTSGGDGTGSFNYGANTTITFTDYTVTYTGFDLSDFGTKTYLSSGLGGGIDTFSPLTSPGASFSSSTNEIAGAGSLNLTFTAAGVPEPSISILLLLFGSLPLLKRNRN